MKSRPAKSLSDLFLHGSAQLKDMYQKVESIKKLDKLLKRFLDPALAAHCKVANIQKSCLILETTSPAWATRLRYQIPDLLNQLRKDGGLHHLGSIRYYIKPQERS